jgi:hypothetical protein
MFKKILLTTLLLMALLSAIGYYLLKPSPLPATQAFINGHILTMDEQQPVAEALFIEHNTISTVGNNDTIKALINSDTVVHDLQGKTLLPGFIDAHSHFPGSALAELNVDLNSPPIGKIKNIAQLISTLQDKAASTPAGDWIFGIGYDDTMLAEQRHPTLAELDLAFPDHPVFLWHISGHMGVANSAAFALVGIDDNTADPEGGVFVRDEQGHLSGLMEENAMDSVARAVMDFSVIDGFRMMKIAGEQYARQGVTTAQSGAVDKSVSQGLNIGSQIGLIPMRLELWPLYNSFGLGLLDGSLEAADFESERVNVGAIKIIADGSIQGYTGYLEKPYFVPFHGDDHYRGYPRIPRAELFDWVEKYHQQGLQLAIHGNGDASIEDIIDAIEAAQAKYPRQDARHIIVHAQMARQDQLERMKALAITPSFFVAHTYYWGDRHRDIFMGPERAAHMSPAASAQALGLPYTIHLDTPVVPMNPLFLVWTAVNRLSSTGQAIGADERISVMQALQAVTSTAAWQIFQQDNRGSITPGKLADLVVLSGDPLLDPMGIKDLHVLRTMVGGRTIFQAEAAD